MGSIVRSCLPLNREISRIRLKDLNCKVRAHRGVSCIMLARKRLKIACNPELTDIELLIADALNSIRDLSYCRIA